jgi:hypothetical protein
LWPAGVFRKLVRGSLERCADLGLDMVRMSRSKTADGRIYQQLLKRKRPEEYRERVNELLGTSPAAPSKLPDLAPERTTGPIGAPTRCCRRPEWL